MMKSRNRFLKITGFVVFGSLFILGVGYVVMSLWNALIPDIFSVNEITYWQALGLLVLARILFGGFGPGRFRRHHHWKEKWMRMSPEERDAFKRRWQHYSRRGSHGHPEESNPESKENEERS